jgi:hypothetical protein
LQKGDAIKHEHVVLVIAANHNPSGHHVSSQEYASVPASIFNKFFAGNGVTIGAKG